jgi:UPF0755 protein
MALQVDSAPTTYGKAGLPSAPISNPGLETIDAALHPKDSNYLYYLTGKDGLMHYSSTYAEHQANIKKYL